MISAGVCGTGNQRIKLGSVFGKFSKYGHGLSECCQFYHLNARSAIHALSPAPGAYALSKSSLVNYRPSLPTFLLQFVALSAIFTPFRVIYSRHKIDWENALINVISDGFLVPSGKSPNPAGFSLAAAPQALDTLSHGAPPLGIPFPSFLSLSLPLSLFPSPCFFLKLFPYSVSY